MTDTKKFYQILGQYSLKESFSQQEAVDARHNLSGFMSLLIKVNDREQIVPTKTQRKASHEN